MMKQIGKMMLLFALLTPAGLVAQDNEQEAQMGRPARVQRMTYERTLLNFRLLNVRQDNWKHLILYFLLQNPKPVFAH